MPELTAPAPAPTTPAPATPTRRPEGPDFRKLLDSAYLPRTVPAALLHLGVGVPLALLLGAVAHLLPGLAGRVAAVVGALGDKWADAAEKDRATTRQAPHADRMAQVTNRQHAQREDTERLAQSVRARLIALRRALADRRSAAPSLPPSIPDPGDPASGGQP
ncbi:hypothetical protein GCM10020369_33460 [Cryptosporangium minutisporangium]|uniref:Uncharacterized protein n=1 Tax=Cryptosporangium minutisporangium TaxID=113569 RepID=A0ABP6SXV5_9ACTN